MQLVNTETIPGWNITEVKGLVSGNTIRAKHLGRDIGAAFKNMAGGELKAYTELLAESRAEATSRMVAEAQALGASAIVNVRFTTSTVAGGAAAARRCQRRGEEFPRSCFQANLQALRHRRAVAYSARFQRFHRAQVH